MNLNLKDITLWLDTYQKNSQNTNTKDKRVIIAPSFPYLGLIAEYTKQLNRLEIAAQDVSEFDKGAHTGEVGGFQLKDFCKYCIVGHSERNETAERTELKYNNCIKEAIIPILCLPTPEAVINAHKNNKKGLLVWEDPSMISSGGKYKGADTAKTTETVKLIRKSLGGEPILIYGGSVNRQNAKDLANIDGLNGVLVGNASNDPDHFIDLVNTF